jgi:hypothetical protein
MTVYWYSTYLFNICMHHLYPFIVNPQMYNGLPSTCTGRPADPPKQDRQARRPADPPKQDRQACKFTNIFLCDIS